VWLEFWGMKGQILEALFWARDRVHQRRVLGSGLCPSPEKHEFFA